MSRLDSFAVYDRIRSTRMIPVFYHADPIRHARLSRHATTVECASLSSPTAETLPMKYSPSCVDSLHVSVPILLSALDRSSTPQQRHPTSCTEPISLSGRFSITKSPQCATAGAYLIHPAVAPSPRSVWRSRPDARSARFSGRRAWS